MMTWPVCRPARFGSAVLSVTAVLGLAFVAMQSTLLAQTTGTASAGGAVSALPIPPAQGDFAIVLKLTVSKNCDAGISIALGQTQDKSQSAVTVRAIATSTGGVAVQARGPDGYPTIAFTVAPDVPFDLIVTGNVGQRRFSAWRALPGEPADQIASNVLFRSGTAPSYLDTINLWADAGSISVENRMETQSVLFSDRFIGNNGLITNEYAYWNSDGLVSSNWQMTSGSLFRKNNTAGTGYPDGPCNVDKYSTYCNNSNVFRATTTSSFTGNVKVSVSLLNNGTAGSDPWDGIHLFMRYQSEFDLYYVSINRADSKAVIKRKIPCGNDNGGTYVELSSYVNFPWAKGVWQNYYATVQTNSDGSVTLKLYNADTNALIVQGTDRGGTNPNWSRSCTTPGDYSAAEYPPLRLGGMTGLRSDFTNFNFTAFTVTSF